MFRSCIVTLFTVFKTKASRAFPAVGAALPFPPSSSTVGGGTRSLKVLVASEVKATYSGSVHVILHQGV